MTIGIEQIVSASDFRHWRGVFHNQVPYIFRTMFTKIHKLACALFLF